MSILNLSLVSASGSGFERNVCRAIGSCAAVVVILAPSVLGSDLKDRVFPGDTFSAAANSGFYARFADFGTGNPSAEAGHMADWVAKTRDADGAEFVLVDKNDARLYVFDGNARLRGSTPVLLGAARGDDSVPDIGLRPIEEVLPQERTTPAGRFVGERGHISRGEDVVWVDYDEGVSIHRVMVTNPKERRLERLATASVEDNRISYGCINVPVAFYETYVRPTFALRRAIVYVLPEVKSVQQVFGWYDVAGVHDVEAPSIASTLRH